MVSPPQAQRVFSAGVPRRSICRKESKEWRAARVIRRYWRAGGMIVVQQSRYGRSRRCRRVNIFFLPKCGRNNQKNKLRDWRWRTGVMFVLLLRRLRRSA